jgi:hypothetical protein
MSIDDELFVQDESLVLDRDGSLQDDILAQEEQLANDIYQAYLEEDIDFEERAEELRETQKAALAPRTLKGYESLVTNISSPYSPLTSLSFLAYTNSLFDILRNGTPRRASNT